MKTVLKYKGEDGNWHPFTGDVPAPHSSIVVKGSVVGAVDGTNKVFSVGFAYIAGTLQAYVNGVAQSEFIAETDPSTGVFTLDEAPATGSSVKAYFHVANTAVGNADTVDGFNASPLYEPNTIPVLDDNGKMPASTVDLTISKSTVSVSGVTWYKRVFYDGRIVYASRHTFSGSAVAANGWNQNLSYTLPDGVVFNPSTMAFAATAVTLDAAITVTTGISSNNTAILLMRTNAYGQSITTSVYTTARLEIYPS